jgi:hypothetical protein
LHVLGVFQVELPLGAQIARQKEIEETPELGDIILNGSATQNQPMRRSDHLYRLAQLGLGALDEVALVENTVAPVLLRDKLNVVADDVVRDYEHVRSRVY